MVVTIDPFSQDERSLSTFAPWSEATQYAQCLQGSGSGLWDALTALQQIVRQWQRRLLQDNEKPTAQRGGRRRKAAKKDDSSDDDDDSMVIVPDAMEEVSKDDLIEYGLQLAQEIRCIPLRQPEWARSWKMEVMEVVLSCLIACESTLAALGALGDEDNAVWTHVLLASKEENSDDLLNRRHEILVLTLRALYPILLQKDAMPNGHAGKVAAAKWAATALVDILQVIRCCNPTSLPCPHTTPRRTSMGLPLTPSVKGALSPMELSPPPRRNSMTPKLKVKRVSTPATNGTSSYRPGPVIRAFVGLLQQLATAPALVSPALRSFIVDTIHRCVGDLSEAARNYFLQFLVPLGRSKVPLHRWVAAELIGAILIRDDWIWEAALEMPETENWSPLLRSPDSLEPAAAVLLHVLTGRMLDRTPTIRATAVTVFSQICRQAQEQRVEAFCSLIADHRDTWMERLRVRAWSDDKATVRRAACTALVDLLLTDSSAADVFDIQVLRRACHDTSVLTRRAAAEALTRLLEGAIPAPPSSPTLLEDAWAQSVLPMVLDTEPTAVSKAVDLVDRLLLRPILGAEEDQPASATAYRILAKLGSETKHARSGAEALRVAIPKCMAATGKSTPAHSYVTLFRRVHATALTSLDDDARESERNGIWCLLDAVLVGNGAMTSAMSRAIQQSRMDMTFIATSWDKLLTLYVANNAPVKSKASLQRCLCHCLRVVTQLSTLFQPSVAQDTAQKLQERIALFSLSPDLIGPAVTALTAMTLASHESYEPCSVFVRSLYQKCEKLLSTAFSDSASIAQCGRALFTIGELSMIGFSSSDDHDVTDDKVRDDSSSNVLARGFRESPSSQLIELVQAYMTSSLPSVNAQPVPVAIRAHAFVTLGKLCLRNPDLAKKSLNVLARELHESIDDGNWILQSNALLVLGDLCVKYTNMVDRFLPVMAGCLQAGLVNDDARDGIKSLQPRNGSSLVRKHAVLLLSSLLLQDYVKWRGLLFHRFLVAAVDDDLEVAELAEMALMGPLLSKQPRLFANHFVESLFVLNRCTDHPIFRAAAAMGDGGSGIKVGFDDISIGGEDGRLRRLRMYELMLSKMSDEEKIGITSRIGREVLGGALQSGSELNVVVSTNIDPNASTTNYQAAFNVLSDALTVLKCPQIRVAKSNRNADDDIEDPNVSMNNAKRAQVARGRLLSNVSRKHLIEILMPILCQLKSVLETSRSPLLKDLMTYLLDVYQRYKTEVQEILANDPTTLQEIEYDARQWKLQNRKASRASRTEDDDHE